MKITVSFEASIITTRQYRYYLRPLALPTRTHLRLNETVFQEIITAERPIYCADLYVGNEFELLVISFYQKLNQERAEMLAEGLCSGRFYNL